MDYPQSVKILKSIKKSKKILINIHPHPDPDSVGSALALANIIQQFTGTTFIRSYKSGTHIDVVSPERIREDYSYLKNFDKVKVINFSGYDFSNYDLLLLIDASSLDRVTGNKSVRLPDNSKVIIDHHLKNSLSGNIKLVDTEACATSEILYKLFLDWKVRIDKDTATCLYAGIAGDTVYFRTDSTSKETFKIASELINLGADKDLILRKLYRSYDLNFLKLVGKFLDGMKKSDNGKFVWSAISFEEYAKLGKPVGGQSVAADMFFNTIKGTDFGIAMLETKKGETNASFRSKPNFDVSILARALGGGGHKNAAGATLFGDFKSIQKKVLQTTKALK